MSEPPRVIGLVLRSLLFGGLGASTWEAQNFRARPHDRFGFIGRSSDFFAALEAPYPILVRSPSHRW